MSSAPRRCLGDVGDVEGFTHACARVWGNRFSPRTQPRAPRGARRSRIRRDVHQCPKHSRPDFAGANRRRPGPTRDAACSSTSAPTVPSAAISSQLAQSFTQPCYRAPGRRVSTLKLASANAASGRRASSWKVWGPRCGVSALVAPSGFFKGGLRWAGGGSHRLAVPGREQLSPRWRVD